MPCCQPTWPASSVQPAPYSIGLNLTYCAAKGLTFDPARICSGRTVRWKLSTFRPRATSVVVPSSGAGKLRKVLLRGVIPFSKLGLSHQVLAPVKAAGRPDPPPLQEQEHLPRLGLRAVLR